MSLLDSIINKVSQSDTNVDESVSKIAADKATGLIKELSGSEITSTKKIIDNLILFTNASGGTGASTVACNVAYALSKKNLKVLMIDLNILCPSQYNYLGLKQQLDDTDLISFMLGECSVGECIKNCSNIDLIYANNRSITDKINANDKVAIQNFIDLIKKLRNLYDFIIVDCPMSIDDMLCNTAMYSADTIYCVWDEGLNSIANTEKIRRNLALTGVDSYTKMRIILNKRTIVRYSRLPIDKMNLDLIGVIPFSADVIDSSLSAQIFCEKGKATSENGIEFAKQISIIADKIASIGGLL